MKFFRLLVKIRYWRLRALGAESELKTVRAQAEAERWRNQGREDMFASAAIMGSRGMWGVPPRTSPAELKQVNQVMPSLDPFSQLAFKDKAEFEAFWWPDAQIVGRNRQQAQNDFLMELAKRKSFNDEPSLM